MKLVISIVDKLLKVGINVIVYNGQFDFIVDIMGQEVWLWKLKWLELFKFSQLKWKVLYSDFKFLEMFVFVKFYKNLVFYWILKVGYMVFFD